MPSFENQILIERPVFDVFKFVGDFKNDSQWRQVHGIGITSGNPTRPGTMIAMTRKVGGFKGFVNADVIEYERNKRIELQGSFWGFQYTHTISFEHRGQQTNIQEAVNIRTRWMFWFGIFFNMTLGRALKNELASLKTLLDNHGDRKPAQS